MDPPASSPSAQVNAQLRLYAIYTGAPRLSLKHDSYFHVYESVLRRYVGQPITFVEVGGLLSSGAASGPDLDQLTSSSTMVVTRMCNR